MNSIYDDFPDPELHGPGRYKSDVSSGWGQVFTPHRAGIPVSIKKLKSYGVRLSRSERETLAPMDGDLIVMRVHDRHLEHQTVARLIQYGEKGFPNVEAQLLNPTIFAAYNRGLILFGQELTLVPGQEKEQYAYYGQAWQCVFR